MDGNDGSHEQGEPAAADHTAEQDADAEQDAHAAQDAEQDADAAQDAHAAQEAPQDAAVAEEQGEGESEEPSVQRRLGAAVSAAGFGLTGPRGPVFEDISFELPAGSLGAIEGASGTGRTCLLLTLTGRMKASSGHAQVGRMRLPKQPAAVRKVTALGPVPGVTDLDPALSVAEHLRERVLLQQRFSDSLRGLFRPRRERAAARRARLDSALQAAGLDLDALPKGPRTRVRDLERMESLRLGVALAMLAEPRLLAVDDLDLKLSDAERERAWALLRSLADAGTTVLAVCAQAPADAVVIRTGARPQPDAPEDVPDEDPRDGDATDGSAPGGTTMTKTKGEAADALA